MSRTKHVPIALLLAIVATLWLASAASAAPSCIDNPPDNSEVDQYQETIPSACGNQGTSSDGTQDGAISDGPQDTTGEAGAGSQLPSTVGPDLDGRGKDGKAISALVASTGAGQGPSKEGGAGKGDSGGPGSVVGALAEGADGSEGGLGLVGIVIAASAALGLILAVRRLANR